MKYTWKIYIKNIYILVFALPLIFYITHILFVLKYNGIIYSIKKLLYCFFCILYITNKNTNKKIIALS